MAPSETLRIRKRFHRACQNCRRKKVRCPGERPICSSCSRLDQMCNYGAIPKTPARSHHMEDRLANLEEKLDLLLENNRNNGSPESHESQDILEDSETPLPLAAATTSVSLGSDLLPIPSMVSAAFERYFERCHRQPIWCFDRDDVDTHDYIPEELVCSVLALTSRFLPEHEQVLHYGSSARTLVMLQIANGTVRTATLESLCLLSFCFFLDGDIQVGQFHLRLGLELARAASLDLTSTCKTDNPPGLREKRCFWSLQLLEHCYGCRSRATDRPSSHWRSFFLFDRSEPCLSHQELPDLPMEESEDISANSSELWRFTVRLCWIWGSARTFVADCSHNLMKKPWLTDSPYTTINSDLLELENRMPNIHRYDNAKFYDREAVELSENNAYWLIWLRLQLTYHTIHAVLNHPFLYLVASRCNPDLSIPNTFWKRSSETALLHATWIIRLIEMVGDKQFRLTDPFFAHVAAIAATVHLFYCCAADSRLKLKSSTDLNRCRRFLQSFSTFSRACRLLDEKVDRVLQIALGSADGNAALMTRPTIHVSTHLMWDILKFNCKPTDNELETGGRLFQPSLQPALSRTREESPTLVVPVATPPTVTVNTLDGEQAAPLTSTRTAPAAMVAGVMEAVGPSSTTPPPSDIIAADTSWLWAEQSHQMDFNYLNYHNVEPGVNDTGGSSWWDFGHI